MRRPWLTAPLVFILAGCIEAPQPLEEPVDPPLGLPSHAFEDMVKTFEGTLTGASVQPDTRPFAFDVPQAAAAIQARLTWTSDKANLGLVLQDSKGRIVESGFRETATTRSLSTLEPPPAGTWTLRVTSTRALEEPFEVRVTVTAKPPQPTVIEQRYEVQPLVSPQGVTTIQVMGFAEINLAMEAGHSFNYTWTASEPVYFNIHYHDEERTVTPVEERGARGTGTFVAPHRQVFSPLWENESPSPISVEVRIEGVFREHSRTR